MDYPTWYYGVAIAFNLGLIGLNLYLLFKLPRWRYKLWKLRQKLAIDERQITANLEQSRQNFALLLDTANTLSTRKQQLRTIYQKLQLVLQIYKFLTFYQRKL